MTSLSIVHDNIGMQIGVRQVIAGWDEGILGDGKDVPPMKVPFSSLCMQPWLHTLLAKVLQTFAVTAMMQGNDHYHDCS